MIPADALRSEAGQVAIKWIVNRPAKTIQIAGTTRYYVPVYKHNVPMFWVDEQDAEKILSIKEKSCNCNNGTYVHAFVLANQIDVNLHRCGQRHCE